MSSRPLLPLLLLIGGTLEFCSANKLYRVSRANCPGGLVFRTPLQLNCLSPPQ
jgi:hypothetical protein